MYHVSFCEQHHEDKPGQHKLPTIKKCVATIRANTPGQTKIAANSFNLMPKKRLLYAPTLSHIYQLRNPIRRERPPKQVGLGGPSLPLHPPPGPSPLPPSTQPPTPRLMVGEPLTARSTQEELIGPRKSRGPWAWAPAPSPLCFLCSFRCKYNENGNGMKPL